MPLLADDPEVRDAVEETLLGAYGSRLQDGQLDEITRQLGHLEAELVAAAVRRHVTDTTPISDRDHLPVGHHPPSVAQLLVWVDRLQQERRRDSRQRSLEADQEMASEPEPVPLPSGLRGRQGLPTEGWRVTPRCRDCGDTGMARFWYEPGYRFQVWLQEEYLQLSPEEAGRLRVGLAICTCSRGSDRPERETVVQVWDPRQKCFKELPAFARLEDVRRVAERRRQVEVEVTA